LRLQCLAGLQCGFGVGGVLYTLAVRRLLHALGQRGLIRAIRLQEIQIAGYAQIAAAQGQLAVFTACPGGFRGELRAFAQFQQ